MVAWGVGSGQAESRGSEAMVWGRLLHTVSRAATAIV